VVDLFVQADPSSRRAEAGLGIGLALVRSLVERHGGCVTVQALAADTEAGSRFANQCLRSSTIDIDCGADAGKTRCIVVPRGRLAADFEWHAATLDHSVHARQSEAGTPYPLVVKKGSTHRRRVSPSMPTPVSRTSMQASAGAVSSPPGARQTAVIRLHSWLKPLGCPDYVLHRLEEARPVQRTSGGLMKPLVVRSIDERPALDRRRQFSFAPECACRADQRGRTGSATVRTVAHRIVRSPSDSLSSASIQGIGIPVSISNRPCGTETTITSLARPSSASRGSRLTGRRRTPQDTSPSETRSTIAITDALVSFPINANVSTTCVQSLEYGDFWPV
jgi:hypothetical protein